MLSNIKGLPKIGYSFRFRYELYNATVSNLDIVLTDRIQEISLSGTDSTQIHAISTYLKEKIEAHGTHLGGTYFRLMGAGLLWLVGIVLINVSINNAKKIKHLPKVLGVFLFISIYLLPWDIWFPGTAIYADSANFLDRNINVISFIGVIISVLIPLTGFLRTKYKQKA